MPGPHVVARGFKLRGARVAADTRQLQRVEHGGEVGLGDTAQGSEPCVHHGVNGWRYPPSLRIRLQAELCNVKLEMPRSW